MRRLPSCTRCWRRLAWPDDGLKRAGRVPAERREASLGGRGAMTAAGPVRYARWDNLDDGPSASIGLAGLPGSPTVHSPDASPPRVSSSGRGLP